MVNVNKNEEQIKELLRREGNEEAIAEADNQKKIVAYEAEYKKIRGDLVLTTDKSRQIKECKSESEAVLLAIHDIADADRGNDGFQEKLTAYETEYRNFQRDPVLTAEILNQIQSCQTKADAALLAYHYAEKERNDLSYSRGNSYEYGR